MPRPYREVEKPLADRMIELIRALQLIRDALEKIRAGELRYIALLSGQLRALLTEKSAKNEPLLLGLAKELERPLRVHCMPDLDDESFPSELSEGLVVQVTGLPITPHPQFKAQVELSFVEMLDRPIVFFHENRYSARTIIDWYANKAGGSHYATRIPEDMASLMTRESPTMHMLVNLVLQLGEAALVTGRQLLRWFAELELHFLIVIPPQPEESVADANFLFDARYEGTSMRITLALNRRLMPSCYVSGLHGPWMRADADRLIDWSEPRYIRAGLTIGDDLSTTLDLAVDGERVGSVRHQDVVFALSDPLDYETFQNRSVDGPEQQFSLGIAEYAMFATRLSPIGSAQMLMYFLEKRAKPDLPVLLYSAGAFGHAPRGTKDINITGRATKEPAGRVLHRDDGPNDLRED